MRSSPTFSETKFNFSFFLTTPAKKPRTECCCQSVDLMIAAVVVSFDCRNIARTVSCLDEAPAAFLAAAALDVAVDRTARRFPLEDGGVRDCLVVRFAAFDLVLVAIWLPPRCQRQHHVLPLTQAPRSSGARRRPSAYVCDSLFQQRGRINANGWPRKPAARYPSKPSRPR